MSGLLKGVQRSHEPAPEQDHVLEEEGVAVLLAATQPTPHYPFYATARHHLQEERRLV